MTMKPFRPVLTIVHALAILITVLRLARRWHIKRLWWDDIWAFLSLLFAVSALTVLWVLGDPKDPTNIDLFEQLTTVFYTSALWSARISMGVAIVRFLPPPYWMRRFTMAVTVLFGLIWIISLTEKSQVCGNPCSTVKIGILETTTDIAADMLLIGIPLCLFWNMKLPGNQRKLLLVVFTGAIFTTIATIVHMIYLFQNVPVLIRVTAHVLADVALVVCNLLVVVPICYRILRKEGHEEMEESSLEYTAAGGASRSTHTNLWAATRAMMTSSVLPPSSIALTVVSTMHSGLFTSSCSETDTVESHSTVLKVPDIGNCDPSATPQHDA